MKMDKRIGSELDGFIEQLMKRQQVPAVSLAVVLGDDTIFRKGYGKTTVDDDGVDVNANTMFRFGSISKPMLGTVIGRLIEKKLLSLESPVSEYLPWLSFKDKSANEIINLRQLLSHTSGLPTEYSPQGSQDESGLEISLREEIPRYDFVAPPGCFWSYSNVGIRLAAHIAEVVTGKYFAQLVDELVFRPLKMDHSTFSPLIALTYSTALPSALDEDGNLRTLRRFTNNAARWPAGGLISNATDLAKFIKLHLNKGKLNGVELLKPKTIDLLHGNVVERNTKTGDGYGLTFERAQYKGHIRVGHSGRHDTYGSRMYMLPEARAGLIIVCNRLSAFEEEIEAIASRVFDLLTEKEPERSIPSIEPITDFVDILEDFMGIYIGPYKGLARLSEGPVLSLNGVSYNITDYCSANDCYLGKDNKGTGLSLSPQKRENIRYLLIDGQPCTEAQIKLESVFEYDESITGRYVSNAGCAEIKVVDNELFYVRAEREYSLIPIDADRFGCDLGLLTVVRDSGGLVTGYTIGLTFHYRKV